MYPIRMIVVEDIKATTHGKGRHWNSSFSPLQLGKTWFYEECEKIAPTYTCQGYETAAERERLGLEKSRNKMSASFSAHCVDAWVMASAAVGGHTKPDNTEMLFIAPLRFHRRSLHRQNFKKDGKRSCYGGTMSLGFKRGSWVKHPKWGMAYVGGTMQDRISLHSLETGKRLTQYAKPKDCQFLTYASWRTFSGSSPRMNPEVSAALRERLS